MAFFSNHFSVLFKIDASRSLFWLILPSSITFCAAVLSVSLPVCAAPPPDRPIILVNSQEKATAWKTIWDEARTLAQQKLFVDAARVYGQLVLIKSDIEEANWEYSKILMKTGDLKGAAALLEKLVEDDQDRLDYLLYSGRVALARKEYKKAVKYFGSVYERTPDGPFSIEALSGLVKGLQELGRKEIVYPLMEQLYLRKNGDVQLLRDLAFFSIERGDKEKARGYCDSLLEKDEIGEDLLLMASALYTDESDQEQAVKYWRKYLEKQPAYIPFRQNLVDYLLTGQKRREALPHILVLLEQGDSRDVLLLEAGRIYLYEEGRPDKALIFFEKYRKKYPDDKQIETEVQKIQTVLANDLISIVENDGAWRLWWDLARITPNRIEIYYAMSQVLREHGMIKELREVLEIIHIYKQEDDANTFELAQLTFASKEYQLSLEYLEKIKAEQTKGSEYYLLAAMVCENLARFTDASHFYQHFLALYPLDMKIRKQLLGLGAKTGLLDVTTRQYKLMSREINENSSLFALEQEYIQILNANYSFSIAEELLRKQLGEATNAQIRNNLAFQLAETLRQGGKYFKSELILRRLFAEKSDAEKALFLLTLNAIDSGKFSSAYEWLVVFEMYGDSAWEKEICGRKNLTFTFLHASLLAADGYSDDAVDLTEEFFSDCAEQLSSYPDGVKRLRIALVRFYIQELNRVQAGRYLHELREQYPADPELFVLHNLSGGLDENAKMLLFPTASLQSNQVLYEIASYELKYGLAEEALGNINVFLQSSPEAVKGLFLKSRILQALNQREAALQIVKSLFEKYPDEYYFLEQKVWLEFKEGQFERVAAQLKEYWGQGQKNYFQGLMLARSLWKTGNQEEAVNIYEQLLQPSVAEEFEARINKEGVSLVLPASKRSIWDIITFTNPEEPERLQSIMSPEFLAAHQKQIVSSIANDFYIHYKWQKLIGNELTVKQSEL